MPDWSYHLIFKPILNKLSPYHSREFIHRGMNRIATFPGGKHFINFLGREETSPKLHTEGNQLHFKNQIGLSGKIDPLLSGINAFSNLGFGFLEVGPVTKTKVEGKPPTVNSGEKRLEFHQHAEARGLAHTIQKLKRAKVNQPIFIRLGGTLEEQLEMLPELEPYGDAFVLTGRVEKSDADRLMSVTERPIFLSVPVNQAAVMHEEVPASFSGVVIDEDETKTDNVNREDMFEAVQLFKKSGYTGTIITVGGVHQPEDALALLEAGVDLLMLSGGYVFAGPGLPKRIKEAQLEVKRKEHVEPPSLPQSGWNWYFLFGMAIFFGGLIAMALGLTTVILPYDEYFLEMTREDILAFNHHILHFMAHDRITLAGTMMSGGILYMMLARFGVREGLLWAKQAIDAAAIIGFLGIFLFIGYGYFDWLHLIFWLVLLPFYIAGFVKSRGITGTPCSSNRVSDSIWRWGLVGQLNFVILGFSFVLGGLIISFIGVTDVFVSTDLLFIGMSPEQLHAFNQNLIPVIAHDRAGFGSALLSVGLLVLVLGLWAFQQGKMWVWWTFLIGGIPAFTAGIGVHFHIGYTHFIHLLPAYFALVLYVVGLVTSYRFFNKKGEVLQEGASS